MVTEFLFHVSLLPFFVVRFQYLEEGQRVVDPTWHRVER